MILFTIYRVSLWNKLMKAWNFYYHHYLSSKGYNWITFYRMAVCRATTMIISYLLMVKKFTTTALRDSDLTNITLVTLAKLLAISILSFLCYILLLWWHQKLQQRGYWLQHLLSSMLNIFIKFNFIVILIQDTHRIVRCLALSDGVYQKKNYKSY